MDARTLRHHKQQPKRLAEQLDFKPAKRGKLPRPLNQVGGARLFATAMLSVAERYQICFLWRDGAILSDTAFYGWLFEVRAQGLSPLASLHYHPSHKPVHLLTPCGIERDFTNRQLPGAHEFNLSSGRLDPRLPDHRAQLVVLFCERCGVALGEAGLLS